MRGRGNWGVGGWGGIGWGGVGFIKVSGTMSGMTACIIQQHIQHVIELLYNMHQVYQLTLIKILDTNTGIYCLVAYNQAPCKKKIFKYCFMLK